VFSTAANGDAHMESAQWERVQSAFLKIVDYAESERASALETLCRGDTDLKTAVTALLDADRRDSILDRGLPEVAFATVGDPANAILSQEFGPYRLIRKIGAGGMGVVWLAERVDVRNRVAIKFLPHAGLSPLRRERFADEIRTLARLRHAFIARLYDAGTLADGTPWFAMEYVEGIPFTEYCRQKASPVPDLLRLFRSVCEAVQYAHHHEIIHRDLKPSNILVESDGTPKLLDFGIAKELRRAGESDDDNSGPVLRFLSSGYAAPEWAAEGIAGAFTDVYSLGAILREMLSGQPAPGSGGDGAWQTDAPAQAQVSKAERNELHALWQKAIHPDAPSRYQSIEALIRDIDHYLKREPLDARPATRRYRLGKFVSRNRPAVLASCLVLTIVAAMIAVFTLRLARERDTALSQASRTERIQSFMLNLLQGGDQDAGPAEDLRVKTLIDRGVSEAGTLSREPLVQAELYQTLGMMDQKLGNLERADSLLHSALAIRKSATRPDYSGVAGNLIALALLQSARGNSREAERSIDEAQSVVKTREPTNRVLSEQIGAAMGQIKLEEGKYSEAVRILEPIVASQSRENPDSSELAKILSALADAEIYQGHYSVSDSLNRRALAIDRKVHGNNHPKVSDDLGNLGQLQETWGHYSDAERFEREALAISRTWYGKDHPDTARKMTTLAQTLIYEGEYQEGDDLLQQALAIQERVYGNRSPHVAYVLNAIGSFANHRREFRTAADDFQRVAEIYRAAYGDTDYRVAVALGNLASVYFSEKNYARAVDLFRDVVARFIQSQSAGSINTGEAEIKLGRALLSERHYSDAEASTRAGYEALSKQTSPPTSYIQGARHDLATIYTALGRPDEAKKFGDEAEIAPKAAQTAH
jgi:eukaryotic-like serine/threonine-protein kinase